MSCHLSCSANTYTSMDCHDQPHKIPPLPPQTSLPEINASHTVADLPCLEDKDHGTVPQVTYQPEDVSRVRDTLQHFLPAELADIIIDKAEIWPYVANSRNAYTPACSALEGPDGNAQWCYLVSPPVPSLERDDKPIHTSVRKVKFYIKSYESSWGEHRQTKSATQDFKTWFEASILKPNDCSVAPYSGEAQPHDWFTSLSGPRPKYLNNLFPIDPPSEGTPPTEPTPNPFDSTERKKWAVTSETPSDGQWKEITWSQEDVGESMNFLDALTVGDRVVLMTRAKAPGWINTIFNVKIEIFYSLDASAYEL